MAPSPNRPRVAIPERIAWSAVVLGLALALGGATPARAEAPVSDERAHQALTRGLDWLARAQAETGDGSWPATGLRAASRLEGPTGAGEGTFAPVAVSALATLALLAGGNTPDRGPHGRECALAVDWIVARTELAPESESRGFVHASGDALSRMHGQGFATLALAQALSMSPKSARGARITLALDAAVSCIERSQGVDGGWWYEPKPSLQHENSITIASAQALRAAHNAGIRVDPRTIARAVDYVGRTQKPDGSFRYALGDEKSSVALTAAAIATFQATGTYAGKVLDDGYDWILRRLAARGDREAAAVGEEFVLCPFYERLFLAQALWQHADRRVFDAWWKTEVVRLVTSQAADGAWRDPRYGDAYATAANCLVLALPDGLLPIFQR